MRQSAPSRRCAARWQTHSVQPNMSWPTCSHAARIHKQHVHTYTSKLCCWECALNNPPRCYQYHGVVFALRVNSPVQTPFVEDRWCAQQRAAQRPIQGSKGLRAVRKKVRVMPVVWHFTYVSTQYVHSNYPCCPCMRLTPCSLQAPCHPMLLTT